jgi:hypothetical protein
MVRVRAISRPREYCEEVNRDPRENRSPHAGKCEAFPGRKIAARLLRGLPRGNRVRDDP